MKLLVIYEKIILAINKEKEKKKNLVVALGLNNIEFPIISLILRVVYRPLLLLWLGFLEFSKFLVRFLCLLFGDSAENFLIFSRLGKDSVIACNNSYCEYKRMERKIRFLSKTAFILILISTILTSSVLYFLMPGKPEGKAATAFNFTQTKWDGGPDGGTSNPDHAANSSLSCDGTQADPDCWTKYSSKGGNIVTGYSGDGGTAGQVKLSTATGSFAETSDSDFNGSNLAGYWNFDEGQGSPVIADQSGNNNTGQLKGTALYIDGTYAAGDKDHVSVPDNANLRISGAITVEAWIYPTGNSDAFRGIVSKDSWDVASNRGYGLALNQQNTVRFELYDGTATGPCTTYCTDGATAIPLNQWTHVVATWDGTTKKIYINGLAETSFINSTTNSYTGTLNASNTNPLLIGALKNTDPYINFKGSISRVRVYNAAISSAVVSEHYQGIYTDTGYTANLKGSWKLTEGTGQTATDSSGNGYNGTLGDTAGSDSNEPTWTSANIPAPIHMAGKFGNALNFDGVDDYVQMGDMLDIGTNDMTISLWYKPGTIAPATNIYAVSKADTSADDGRYGVGISTDGKVRAVFDPGTVVNLHSTTSLTTDWTYITVVFDRDSDMSIYINGTLNTSQSISSGNGQNYNTLIPFYVGAYYDDGNPSRFFNGSIDDVKIYNAVLNAEQIQKIYLANERVKSNTTVSGSGNDASIKLINKNDRPAIISTADLTDLSNSTACTNAAGSLGTGTIASGKCNLTYSTTGSLVMGTHIPTGKVGFYNVGTFAVNNGVTITLPAYNGTNGGRFRVVADTITVSGTINGDGKGYAGGGIGSAGTNGSNPAGAGGNGSSGTNGGSYGGAGGPGGNFGTAGNSSYFCNPARTGGNGGSGGSSVGSIYGTNYGTEIDMGGGGGGGGGAGGSTSDCLSTPGYPTAPGAGLTGGAGGGSVYLYASNSFTLSNTGTISAKGGAGGNGGDSSDVPYGGKGGGAAGGAGAAGGGILINGESVSINGVLNTDGGAGGTAPTTGAYCCGGTNPTQGGSGNLGGSGRIKIFGNASIDTTGSTITATGYNTSYSGCNSGSIYCNGQTKNYHASGTYTSQIYDTQSVTGQKVAASGSWGTLTWNDSVPGNASVTVKVRSSSSADMSGATAWGSCLGISKGANLSTGGCVTDGHRYLQYQATLNATSDYTDTPTLSDVTVNYNYYPASQTLVSSAYDTGDDYVIMNTFTWTESLYSGTDVKFRVKTASTKIGLDSAPWCGPDDNGGVANGGCSSLTYYSTSGSDIVDADLQNGLLDRWIQYELTLTSDGSYTPTLDSVSVGYLSNSAPSVSAVSASQITDDQNANYGKIYVSGYTITDGDSSSFTASIYADLGIAVNEGGGSLTISDTTNLVVSGGASVIAALPQDGIILIDSEQIAYISRSGSTLNLDSNSRGRNNTKITSHANSAKVYFKGISVSGDAEAVLAASVNNSVTSLSVSNASSFPASGTVRIDSEEISFASKTDNGDGTWTLGGASRGINSTAAASHVKGASIIGVGFTEPKITGIGTGPYVASGKTAVWDVKNDFPNIPYAETAQVRVFANDGQLANQSSGESGSTAIFTLDTTNPAAGSNPIIIDAKDGLNSSVLTLSASDDDATFKMKLSNNSDLSADGLNADSGTWIAYSASKSWKLSTDPDIVYAQFRDSRGNLSSAVNFTSISAPSNFMIQDTSNLGSGEFREFVAWKASTISNFLNYTLESSTDASSYAVLTTISSPQGPSLNYYAHQPLTQNQDYYYRVYQQDSIGNKSPKTSVKHGRANGAQDFDEGGGGVAAGVDATAPVLSGISVSGVTSSGATFSWQTDEASDSFVAYSTNTSYTSEQGKSSLELDSPASHTVTIVGLSENTLYHYKIKSRDASGNVGSAQDDTNYVFTTSTDTQGPVITFDTAADITNITDSGATITWTTDEVSTSRVDYGTTNSYGSNSQDASYNMKHTITLSGLAPSTPYYFKITSRDNSISQNSSFLDNSGAGYSFTTLASQDTTPPNITLVSSGSVTYNSAAITWTTNEVSNSLVDFGSSTSYGTTQGNSADSLTSHSVTLIGLAPSTPYYFRVKSMDASGNIRTSDNSGAGYTFTTANAPNPGDTTPPAISNVSQNPSVTSTTAAITWTTNENSDSVVGYSLNTSFNSEQGSATAATNHSVTLSNLAPSTTYYFKVKSRDASGNLGYNDNSGAGYSFTTLAGGDFLDPVISNVLIDNITSSSARITWATNENSNSLIDYSKTSGVFTSTQGKYQDNTTSHSVTLVGLDPSTPYYAQARSSDPSANEGKDSSGGTGYAFTTLAGSDSTPPQITLVSSGSVTYNSVAITWTTDEISNSLVDFGTTISYGTTQGNSADSLTSHSVTLIGLAPSTLYYYRVKSIDSSGNLGLSDNSGAGYTFTTASGLNPGDVTAPVITFNPSTGITGITANSATIAWTTDENSDSTVGYSLDTSFSSEKGSATQASNHSVTLSNLAPSTAYKIRIKSRDSSGNLSTESNSGAGYSFTTLAGGDAIKPVISNVAVTSTTDTTAAITWTTDENSNSNVDYGTNLGTYTASGGNALASATSHPVTLTGLTASTSYFFRVRSSDANGNEAVDAGGTSGYTFTTAAAAPTSCPSVSCGGGSSVSIDTNPPTISNIKVSDVTASSAAVTWETNEKGDSITEYGTTVNYGNIAGTRTTTKTHAVILSELKPDTTYNYKVTSADSSGNLAQSDNLTFKTLSLSELTPKEEKEEEKRQEEAAKDIQKKIEDLIKEGMDEETVRDIIARATQPPSIKGEGPIVSDITNSSVKISWSTDRKSNSVIRFKVKEEGVNPGDSSYLRQFGSFTEITTEHAVNLNSLLSGTTYQFQAQSSDILGNTGKSNWKEFTTGVIPSIYDVIVSDTTLNSVIINWKTNVVSTSSVEYGKTVSYTDKEEDRDNMKVAKHSLKLNNLSSGTAYHYRIRGIDSDGNALVSDDYTFTTFTLPRIESYVIEKVEESSVLISWKTNVETDSAVKYTDTETKETKRQTEDHMSTIHNFTLKAMDAGKEYLLSIEGRDIYGNEAVSDQFLVRTLKDTTPAKITQVKTETAIPSGKSDIVQTIVSWKTDEPATSQVFWEEGITESSDLPNSTSLDKNYTTNHIVVITSFKPSSVYRFRAVSMDRAENAASSGDFTILIPEKKKSVVQIIIQNFENTFGWVKNLGL